MKKIITVFLTLALTVSCFGQAFAADGSWIQTEQGRKYQYADGTMATDAWLLDIDYMWYHFNADGTITTGDADINNYKYQFSDTGAMTAYNVTRDNLDKEFIEAVNSRRAAIGVPAVTVDENLMKAAQTRANEISTMFSHARPDGREYSTALTEAGATFTESTEFILVGDNSSDALVSTWCATKANKDQILGTAFSKIGYAYCESNGITYWVMLMSN